MEKARQQPYSIANPTAAADGEKPFGNKSEGNRKEIDKKKPAFTCTYKKLSLLLHPLTKKVRAFSSAGLEHLPYKQRVGGSNPSTPTKG